MKLCFYKPFQCYIFHKCHSWMCLKIYLFKLRSHSLTAWNNANGSKGKGSQSRKLRVWKNNRLLHMFSKWCICTFNIGSVLCQCSWKTDCFRQDTNTCTCPIRNFFCFCCFQFSLSLHIQQDTFRLFMLLLKVAGETYTENCEGDIENRLKYCQLVVNPHRLDS